jgi:hypothetical protein
MGTDTHIAASAEPGVQTEDFPERVRVNQTKLTSELRPHNDFIVGGSGSSGSVVARRLAENPDVNTSLGVWIGGDFSDGRVPDLSGQAKQPPINPNEMNNTPVGPFPPFRKGFHRCSLRSSRTGPILPFSCRCSVGMPSRTYPTTDLRSLRFGRRRVRVHRRGEPVQFEIRFPQIGDTSEELDGSIVKNSRE